MGPESHRAQVHVHIEDSLAAAVDRMAEGWRVGSLSLSAPLCLSVSVCVLSLSLSLPLHGHWPWPQGYRNESIHEQSI